MSHPKPGQPFSRVEADTGLDKEMILIASGRSHGSLRHSGTVSLHVIQVGNNILRVADKELGF